jgi:hypothetical protein
MRSDGFWPIGSVAQSSGGMLTSMLPTADSWIPQAEAMLDTRLPARRDLASVRRPAMSRFTSVSPLTTRPSCPLRRAAGQLRLWRFSWERAPGNLGLVNS